MNDLTLHAAGGAARSDAGTLRRLHNPVVTLTRVLLIEDDPDLRSGLAAHLGARGFDVTAVADGISAIEALREEDHDVILLDLGIPRMNGTKFLHELRRMGDIPEIPVVILSGSDDHQIESASGLGVFAVHRKPTRAYTVARTLRAAAYHG